MLVALDTNILVYAEGVGAVGDHRFGKAISLLQELPSDQTLLPVQVLGELFNVLVRKGGFSRHDAAGRLAYWHTTYPILATTAESFVAATDLATVHNFTIWDALILTIAARVGCRALLSEDMQDGFNWGGVTVVNPFATAASPLMTALLEGK